MYERITVDGARWLSSGRLGDPARREVGLLLPPGYEGDGRTRYPLVICLSGFGSTGPAMAEAHHALEPPLHVQLSRAMKRGAMAPAIVAFPDCATRYGGCQFVNGANAGAMQDFLLDGLVDHIDATHRTLAEPHGRVVAGRSSGGYGAMCALIDCPDRVGAAGALAPDCMFEHCYLPFFPATLDYWREAGGYGRFVSAPQDIALKDHRYMLAMSLIGMASVYAPRETPDRHGALFALPYDPETGLFDVSIWEEWKAHDIDRRLAATSPDRLAGLRTLRIAVGARDEYNMAISARFLKPCLEAAGLRHELEIFDGYHGGNASVLVSLIAALLADGPVADEACRPATASRSSATTTGGSHAR